MKNEQILKKVISKAVENGYKGELITKLESGNCVTHCSNAELIFSHDFAKAFWKTGKGSKMYSDCYEGWRYHQHKMLDEIQEGRCAIKYLSKFIEK